MSLDIYTKDPPQEHESLESYKKRDRFFALSISTLGMVVVVFAVWPIFIWIFNVAPSLTLKINNVPVPKDQVLSESVVNDQNIQVISDPDGFSYFVTNYQPQGPRPKDFYISIPKLKIENAHVLVDSLKFDQNLTLFPGSALPGEIGNSFITGHSVLPQFFNAKDYKTIFSNLPDLEIGDVITVDTNGQTYNYVVQYKKIVDPKDTSVLKPISPSAKNLTLMTCVPPGTSLKRMVVVTGLI